jgi:hypothetical protein
MKSMPFVKRDRSRDLCLCPALVDAFEPGPIEQEPSPDFELRRWPITTEVKQGNRCLCTGLTDSHTKAPFSCSHTLGAPLFEQICRGGTVHGAV